MESFGVALRKYMQHALPIIFSAITHLLTEALIWSL
jgi:hypothetical protein